MVEHVYYFRIRYADIDQMGTYYNARALEWFEAGRSELARHMGLPYSEWEPRGVFLPLVEAHLKFQGMVKFDDLMKMTTRVEMEGRARIRFSNEVVQAEKPGLVCKGYTIHAILNREGRPMRAPEWVEELVQQEMAKE